MVTTAFMPCLSPAANSGRPNKRPPAPIRGAVPRRAASRRPDTPARRPRPPRPESTRRRPRGRCGPRPGRRGSAGGPAAGRSRTAQPAPRPPADLQDEQPGHHDQRPAEHTAAGRRSHAVRNSQTTAAVTANAVNTCKRTADGLVQVPHEGAQHHLQEHQSHQHQTPSGGNARVFVETKTPEVSRGEVSTARQTSRPKTTWAKRRGPPPAPAPPGR